MKPTQRRWHKNGPALLVAIAFVALLFSARVLATGPLDKPGGFRGAPSLDAAEKLMINSNELQKIEALLKNLETLKETKFIRNDEALPLSEAVALMRNKWKAQAEDIKTATEFIDKVMTSSTSGARKPYLLRSKDGKETKCADYLKAELKKMDAVPKKTGSSRGQETHKSPSLTDSIPE